MARTRGGKRSNTKTPLAAPESTSHNETGSPANHESKSPYVCSTGSKGYVLRDSFLAHSLIHTKEKFQNVKPKRHHQRELGQTSSHSPTTVSSALKAELGISLDGQTSTLSPTTIPSAWEAELGRSLEGQTSSLSPTTVSSAWESELDRSVGVTSPSFSSPFPSQAAAAASVDTSSSSLSSTPSAPKSATKRPNDSACVTDVKIQDYSGPKMLKKCSSSIQENNNEAEQTMKKNASNIQDKNNEDEPTIIISDDEEDSVRTPETGGNYARFMSTTAVSTSHLDVTSFKSVEKEYSDSTKTSNSVYKDSGTNENVSHSYPLPKAKMNQGDPTVIIKDDDEPLTPMETGSSQKKNVTKRLFSDFRQNQIRNGGFDSLGFKSGEDKSNVNLNENSSGDVKEALDKISQLGPIITVTKTKTSSDTNDKKTKEAIDKIKQLGPAISLASISSVTNEELSTTKNMNKHANVAQNIIKEGCYLNEVTGCFQNIVKEESEPENKDEEQIACETVIQNVINTESVQALEYPDKIVKSGSLGEDEALDSSQVGEQRRRGVDEVWEHRGHGMDEAKEYRAHGVDEAKEYRAHGVDEVGEHRGRGVDEAKEYRAHGVDEAREHGQHGADEEAGEHKRHAVGEAGEHRRQGMEEAREHRRHAVGEAGEHRRCGVDDAGEHRRCGVDEAREQRRQGVDEVRGHRQQEVGCCGACRRNHKIKIKMEIEMSTEQFLQVAKEMPNIVTDVNVHSS